MIEDDDGDGEKRGEKSAKWRGGMNVEDASSLRKNAWTSWCIFVGCWVGVAAAGLRTEAKQS